MPNGQLKWFKENNDLRTILLYMLWRNSYNSFAVTWVWIHIALLTFDFKKQLKTFESKFIYYKSNVLKTLLLHIEPIWEDCIKQPVSSKIRWSIHFFYIWIDDTPPMDNSHSVIYCSQFMRHVWWTTLPWIQWLITFSCLYLHIVLFGSFSCRCLHWNRMVIQLVHLPELYSFSGAW